MRMHLPYIAILSLIIDLQLYSNCDMPYYATKCNHGIKEISERPKRFSSYKKTWTFNENGLIKTFHTPYVTTEHIYHEQNGDTVLVEERISNDISFIGKTKEYLSTFIHSLLLYRDRTSYQTAHTNIYKSDTMYITNIWRADSTGNISTHTFTRTSTRNILPDTFKSVDSFTYTNDTIIIHHYESHNNTPIKLQSKTICVYKNNTITNQIFTIIADSNRFNGGIVGVPCYDESLSKIHIKYDGHDKRGNWTRSYYISKDGKRKFRSKRKISYYE